MLFQDTVSLFMRSGTRAAFLDKATADKPSGLVIGFDITRQIH